ncbi:MAG: hypothetical protein ACRDRX_17350 [Pseudonocardiaceae bacterium]
MIVASPPARQPSTRLARLSPRSRKVWLTAHVATSVGWLGSAYTMLVLGLAALHSGDHDFRVTVYEIMHLFDRAVNIPLFLAALLTGLVVSLRTKWGLLRHWWVAVKLVLSLLVAFGAYLLSVPRVLSMIAATPAGTDTGSTAIEIVAISIASITVLTAVTAISVGKPWGRIRRVAGYSAPDRAL